MKRKKVEVVPHEPLSLMTLTLSPLKIHDENFFQSDKNLTLDDIPDMLSFTCRFQKNSQKVQTTVLVKDVSHPNLCPVQEAVLIKHHTIHHTVTRQPHINQLHFSLLRTSNAI